MIERGGFIMDAVSSVLKERESFVHYNNKELKDGISCEEGSVSGVVSQRACVYCGARVVLNPITDAIHLIHGPIGCASYTWDIRGSLSSDKELYRNSFSTDLSTQDIIFGGEKKLERAIDEIVKVHEPKVIFVYATCVVGVIGDDLEAVCKVASQKYGIRVIPVQSSGFAGTKRDGYKAACETILRLIDEGNNVEANKIPNTINYLGDFNLAAEAWIIKSYLNKMGLNVNVTITGDSKIEEFKGAKNASFNIVQCAGSMTYMAKRMEAKYNIPFINIRFLGIEDTVMSLRKIAKMTGDQRIIDNTEVLIKEEVEKTNIAIEPYRRKMAGKKVAIYVGGGFKAISLIKQFRDLGIEPVVVGTQTGKKNEYSKIKELADDGTVILDDANPSELEYFMKLKKADILVGGVKERPLAYKLGLSFIDHNHERKHPLSGFVGAINFAKEVDLTVNSPVWEYIKREALEGGGLYGE